MDIISRHLRELTYLSVDLYGYNPRKTSVDPGPPNCLKELTTLQTLVVEADLQGPLNVNFDAFTPLFKSRYRIATICIGINT